VNAGSAYVFSGFIIGARLDLILDGSGGYFICFNCIPDLAYRVQRATVVTGPWDTIDTQTAPASGLIEYHETNPLPNQAFYRTAQP